jgi:hypothetical protein
VLIVTHLAGRSGLMGGGFVIAVFIARSTDLRRLGYLGIAANVLLFLGDLMTGDSTSPGTAALVGVGYVLLLAWFAFSRRSCSVRRRLTLCPGYRVEVDECRFVTKATPSP